MAVGQPAYLLLIHRTRGQARSHIFMAVAGGNFASGTNQCGSWLACDGGGSARLFAADTPHSRASPLPHLGLCRMGNFASGTNQCGSWLACDGGGSARLSAADTPHSRASPLPHFLNCGGW